MKTTLTKVVLRAIGTLAGLFGLLFFGFNLALIIGTFRRFDASLLPFELILLLPLLAVSLYLIYIGYAVWFRFGPAVVRHCCAVIGLFVFLRVMDLFVPRSRPPTGWEPLAMLACALFMYAIYRFTYARLTRLLFPAQGEAPAPTA